MFKKIKEGKMKKVILGLIALAGVSFASEYLNPYWFQDGEKEMVKKDYIESNSVNSPYKK